MSTVRELKQLAKERGPEVYSKLNKSELLKLMQPEQEVNVPVPPSWKQRLKENAKI